MPIKFKDSYKSQLLKSGNLIDAEVITETPGTNKGVCQNNVDSEKIERNDISEILKYNGKNLVPEHSKGGESHPLDSSTNLNIANEDQVYQNYITETNKRKKRLSVVRNKSILFCICMISSLIGFFISLYACVG
jgi:hypothetical protein